MGLRYIAVGSFPHAALYAAVMPLNCTRPHVHFLLTPRVHKDESRRSAQHQAEKGKSFSTQRDQRKQHEGCIKWENKERLAGGIVTLGGEGVVLRL